MAIYLTRTLLRDTVKKVVSKSGYLNQYSSLAKHIKKDVGGENGISFFFRRQRTGYWCCSFQSAVIFQMHGVHTTIPCFSRSITSTSSETGTLKKTPRKQENTEPRNDVAAQDPFDDSPTYNIPEKPVSFVEGASYSVVIFAGLGVAILAGYAVFKELILQPNDYKVFGKALARVQDDAQVRVRIGSPVKGYGQESWNRGARQQIPSRTWTDEDGIEHVEVQFLIRGPQGGGKVFAEMFKDKVEKQWKYTYLIVEIASPSHSQLMLESYVPA